MDIQMLNYILVIVVAVVLIAIIVMLFFNHIWSAREKDANATIKIQAKRLAIILQTGKLSLWTYQVNKHRYTTIATRLDQANEYNPIDFELFYDRDDFERMRNIISNISDGKTDSGTLLIKGIPSADGEQSQYEVMLSILERDRKGHVRMLLGVQRDITNKLKREHEMNQLLMRYHTVFNSSLADMIYYDKDGKISDINDKASSSFNIDNKGGLEQSNLSLKDNPIMFDSIDLTRPGDILTTAILDVAHLEKQGYRLTDTDHGDKFYYESSINPVTNMEGQPEGIYVSGRNVTEMVESFHRQQEGLKQLQVANKNIQDYIRNINYALRVSNVRLVNYYPDKSIFEVSDNVKQSQLQLSQVRCTRIATPQFRKTVSIALNSMDHRRAKPIEQVIEIGIHDHQGRPMWLLFNMVPLFDSNGQVERYFGMCRNMTEMVETERRLAVESKKALEAEKLKQMFLTNMSYEIRTPLNTVVGFAELFEADHDKEDEHVFVEEIKKNSNQLLNLVNDILFLSRLDAGMIENNRSETDFAIYFDSYCSASLALAKPEVKIVIENEYEHLVVDIDLENVNKLIQKVCKVAIDYTHEGRIRCRYEYWHGELIIIIEDTGVGIDADRLPKIFSRFNHNSGREKYGTGLDLPIIKAMAQMMGGDIEIQSEKGKGTTVRVTIPCTASVVEKKIENTLAERE